MVVKCIKIEGETCSALESENGGVQI